MIFCKFHSDRNYSCSLKIIKYQKFQGFTKERVILVKSHHAHLLRKELSLPPPRRPPGRPEKKNEEDILHHDIFQITVA